MAVIKFELPKLSVIYVFRIEDEDHKDCLKIGETSLPAEPEDIFSLQPNARVLKEVARNRIKSYTQTAAIRWQLLYTETGFCQKEKKIISFSDKDVHRVLLRSNVKRKEFPGGGKEWFRCNLETVKAAIRAVKEGREALSSVKETADVVLPIVFRPEQQDAIKKTVKRFKDGNPRMLWNAKMRFGKTLCALQTVKELQYGRTLILTHRPVVNDGWCEDFNKIFADSPEYAYASKNKGESLDRLEEECSQGKKKYVYFASLQDLRGSEKVGGNFDKNDRLFSVGWDLVIIDEAHEGTQTDLGQEVLKALVKDHTKELHLSGTPFNLLDNFEEDGIYTWDYTMEQRAKEEWDATHFGDPNPYADLPKLHILTYNLGKLSKELARFADKETVFNFQEFFRTNKRGGFVHENAIDAFLNLLVRTDSENYYPFASENFRKIFRHTLWVLPGVKEAAALESLLNGHEVFGSGGFKIVNVAGDGGTNDDAKTKNALESVRKEAEKTKNALEKVRHAITEHPEDTRTITLTCGRLTTGVSVPAWTGVFMLAGSYHTKASTYMQTIFRVQTPAVINGRRKEDCYVFDFAPDRTLQVLASVSKVSYKAGQTTKRQKGFLGEFLKFCPVIAISGGKMEELNVSRMLQELKKVYIERVVRNGFEDACLYNEKLLQLKGIDLEKFKKLKAIIGETKAMPGTGEIDVNAHGLTGEEKKEKEGIVAKPKKERTPEEEKRLAELREKTKNRQTAISILRGISIRMPLLIYGAEIESEREELTLEKFVKLVDNASWAEFMPNGVTKELFKEFIPYYDEEIFTAAAKRIRAMTRAADTLTVEERIERIAEIFGNFRNPDKETVLTPWRVVNLHMGETLGGYCFFDKEYKQIRETPRFIEHAGITAEVFNPESRLLEINSKSGLYPLYLAYSVYRSRLAQCIKKPSTHEEHLALWDKTLAENLYVVCKTPMAKDITHRTLAGFRKAEVRMWAPKDLINQIKNKQTNFIDKIRDPKHFNTMKINAVVGNPPYQEEGLSTRKSPVYHLFYDAAFQLSQRVSLLTPGRFLFRAGQTPKDWIEKILNDNHFKVVRYFAKSTDVFPTVDIKDGVVVSYRDAEKDFGKISFFSPYPELMGIMDKVSNHPDFHENEFCKFVSSRGLYRFSSLAFSDFPELVHIQGKGSGNQITPNSFDRLENIFLREKPQDPSIQIYGRENNKQRSFRWIKKQYVEENEYLKTYNVFVPEANGSGAIGEVLSTPLIGQPLIGHTDTFISIGKFDNREEAENCLKYLKTKFARTMLGTLKATQHNPRDTWANVPMQDFTNQSDLDWGKSIGDLDEQLYEKYGLNDQERHFIEQKVKEM